MGRALPDDRRELAPALALHHPVPRAPRRPAPDRLHHQQHREPQPPDPQSDQDPRALPRRASRHEADLPRNPPRPDRLEDPLPLDNRPQGPEDPLRRPTPRLTPPTSPDLKHRRSDSLARDPRLHALPSPAQGRAVLELGARGIPAIGRARE